MDESALEHYFDNFITNGSWTMEGKEELNEEFLSLLPDELLALYESSQDHTDETRQAPESQHSEPDSRNSPDSQNLPSGSSVVPVSHLMELPVIVPQIQNVISSVRLGCPLDLNLIACTAWNVEYNPKVYDALTMRIRKPQSSATIYKNGHVICTGAKSEDQSRMAIRRYARILQKLGFPVTLFKIKILNLVASCHTFPVSIEKLVEAHRQRCSYEPELFPALFYNVMPGINATIFATGNISLSGAKTQAEVYRAFDIIFPILSRFRRR